MRGLVVATLILTAAGCAPRPAVEADTALLSLERVCAQTLLDLDALIVSRRGDDAVSADALAEARALRDTAADLYVNGEYELALDLCDQAFLLLGKET